MSAETIERDASTVGPAALLDALPHPVVLIADDNSIAEANSAAETFFKTSASMLRRTSVEHYVPFGSPLLALIEQVRSRIPPSPNTGSISAHRAPAVSASSTSTPRPARAGRSS